MNVFLVPVGGDRFELYCETPIADPAATPSRSARRTWWKRQVDRFRHLISEADDWERRRELGEPETRGRLRRFVMRKIAEAVAEQRLVWQLRGQTSATLVHPAAISSPYALDRCRAALRDDFEKHRRWMVIDGLIFLAFVPLTIVPGPNLPAIYFGFRALGHLFSMSGARTGLRRVAWTMTASPELDAIAGVLTMPDDARNLRLREIGQALGLDRLSSFIDRVRERNA